MHQASRAVEVVGALLATQPIPHQLVLLRFGVAVDHRGQRGGIDGLVPRRGRGEGRVRAEEAAMQHPGPFAAAGAQEADGVLRGPGGIRRYGRHASGQGGRARRAVGCQQRHRLRRQRHALGAHPGEIVAPFPLVEMGEDAPAVLHIAPFPEPDVVRCGGAWIRHRRRIAHQSRVIPGSPEFQRQVGVARIQRHAVRHHPVVHDIQARQHRRPSRAAGRALSEMSGEHHPTPRQRVQVRRAHASVARTAEIVGAPLVGDDEDDILAAGHVDVACSGAGG